MVDGDELVYWSGSGSVRRHLGLRIPALGSLSGLCIARKSLLTCSDSEVDPRVNRDACRRVGLRSALQAPHDGPTVVVTHHAPCTGSIHPKYADSPITPAFVSDLDELVEASGAALWIHGHVHDSYDYRVGNTRVLCNPRGYGKEGVNENRRFDPALTVTVGE